MRTWRHSASKPAAAEKLADCYRLTARRPHVSPQAVALNRIPAAGMILIVFMIIS
jgi:hypothetical protein